MRSVERPSLAEAESETACRSMRAGCKTAYAVAEKPVRGCANRRPEAQTNSDRMVGSWCGPHKQQWLQRCSMQRRSAGARPPKRAGGGRPPVMQLRCHVARGAAYAAGCGGEKQGSGPSRRWRCPLQSAGGPRPPACGQPGSLPLSCGVGGNESKVALLAKTMGEARLRSKTGAQQAAPGRRRRRRVEGRGNRPKSRSTNASAEKPTRVRDS